MLLSLLWSRWQRKRVFSSETNTEGGGRKAPNSSQPCSKLRCSSSLLQLFHFKWSQRKYHQRERRTTVVMYTNQMASIKCSILKYGLFSHSLLFLFFCLPWGYSSGNNDACNFLAGSFWRQACDGWHEQCREEESARDKMWNQYPGFGAP